MTTTLGVRICPNLGCGRRTHVTPGGTVYGRCLAHTLPLLRAFGHAYPVDAVAVSPRGDGVLPIGTPVAAAGSRPHG